MLPVLMCCFLLVSCSTSRSAPPDPKVTNVASDGFPRLTRWTNTLGQPVFYGSSVVPAGCTIDVYPYYCGGSQFIVVTTMEGAELVISVKVSDSSEAN